MICAGGGGICGGGYAMSTYQYDDASGGRDSELAIEVVSGAAYLGCFQDSMDNRFMTFADNAGPTTAKVSFTVFASCPRMHRFRHIHVENTSVICSRFL